MSELFHSAVVCCLDTAIILRISPMDHGDLLRECRNLLFTHNIFLKLAGQKRLEAQQVNPPPPSAHQPPAPPAVPHPPQAPSTQHRLHYPLCHRQRRRHQHPSVHVPVNPAPITLSSATPATSTLSSQIACGSGHFERCGTLHQNNTADARTALSLPPPPSMSCHGLRPTSLSRSV